jgi:hypothetical protein
LQPLCAVSIDVDSIRCYYRIHGLGEAPADLREVIIRRTIPRFAEIFARRGLAATFFIVAEDIDVEAFGASARAGHKLVSELAAAGHEIGNHSYSHPYDLARLSVDRVAEEIGRAHDVLSAAAGTTVRGFRAPGYDISAAMIEQLMQRGYSYDSSIFPAPGYYAAKALVLGAMGVARMKSGAVLTNPRALLAPTDPYRPSPRAPWRRGQASLVELPIAVTRGTRVPVIGTNVLLAPTWLRARLLDGVRHRPLFNFEMHAIDLADAEADGIPGELVAKQPDLRRSLKEKERVFEATLDRLALDYEFVTLDQAANWVHREAA